MTRRSMTVIFEGDSPVRTGDLLRPPETLERGVQKRGAAIGHEGESPDDLDLRPLWLRERFSGVWQLRDGKLWWISSIDGRRRRGDEPILAVWYSGVLRILGPVIDTFDFDVYPDGTLTLSALALDERSDQTTSPLSPWRSRGCRELLIKAGCVVRERRVDMICDDTSPIWERLPVGAALFQHPTDRNPLSICPTLRVCDQRTLRRACWRARTAQRLTPGDAQEALGEARRKGWKITAWEAGLRHHRRAWVERYRTMLGISSAAVRSYDRDDDAAAAADQERWAMTPVRPTIAFRVALRTYLYEAPAAVPTGDEAAALAWARDCVALTWRPATLVVSRRLVLAIDEEGDDTTEDRPFPPFGQWW